MSSFIIYLVKVSIISSLFYTFFYFFLRKETYFKANRIFLIISLLLSFLIPVLDIEINTISDKIVTNNLQHFLLDNKIEDFTRFDNVNVGENSQYKIVSILYILGCTLMSVIFMCQLLQLIKIIRQSSVVKQGRYKEFVTDLEISPFSIFRYIVIPKSVYDNGDYGKILKHEQQHSNQWHTSDLLIVEIILVLLWFNPFVFFYKKSIRENHEFLADKGVIGSGVEKTEYMINLSQFVLSGRLVGFTSNYNCSTIKKRLIMLTSNKSNRLSVLRYFLIFPLIAVVMSFFSFTIITIGDSSQVSFKSPIDVNLVRKIVPFGKRYHPIVNKMRFHSGIDIPVKSGTEIKACATGKVVKTLKAAKKNVYGNAVMIQHTDGYSTLYSHMLKYKVKVGDYVKQGEVIGYVGSTGMSTGPHLHLEVSKDLAEVDPLHYIKELKKFKKNR